MIGIVIRTARVYDDPDPDEGVRVLVDRLWPRGMRRGDPRIGRWDKQVAPSTELRRWYGHDAARYPEFARRYRAELAEPKMAPALDGLRGLAATGTLTLVTATKDVDHSELGVLKEILEEEQ